MTEKSQGSQSRLRIYSSEKADEKTETDSTNCKVKDGESKYRRKQAIGKLNVLENQIFVKESDLENKL